MKDDNLSKDKCDFPKGTRYQPIIQAIVDAAHCTNENKRGKRPIAIITSVNSPSPLHNIKAGPSIHPVAVVMGYVLNPVGYIGSY